MTLHHRTGIKYTIPPILTKCGLSGSAYSVLPIANKHAPLRTMRVRARSSPWITSTLKRCMHDRDILKIKASKSKNPSDWMQFKKQRNIVNKEIRLAKQAYYQNTFNENKGDSKRTWQTINELTSRKSGKTTVTSLKVNGLSVTNPSELSDKFITILPP